jgi:Lon protease-like protein
VGLLPEVIPIFPLPDVVLFPRMVLPLHIFEPRYRKMVADALEGAKVIGMALLRPGWEDGYEGRPPVYERACAGLIEQCETLPDGRFNLVLRGLARVRIVEELAGQPYRLARIAAITEAMGDTEALEAARRRALAAIGRATDGPAVLVTQPELPHDVFVNALCQSMSLSAVERQSLLECDTILQRYERLVEILEFRSLEAAWGPGKGSVH